MNCILCRRPIKRPLEMISASLVAELWRKTQGMEVSDLISSLEIGYYACQSCGLKFFSFKGASGLERMYQELAQKDWYFHERGEYTVIKKYLRRSRKLLDIGGGDDHFRRSLAHLKLEVESSDPYVGTRTVLSKEFDYLTVLQVLEHLDNPQELLVSSLSKLRPGGLLFISVPNHDGFMGKIWRENALDLPPHHLSHWNFGVFQALPVIIPELELVKIHRVCLEEMHLPLYARAYGVKSRAMLRMTRRFRHGHSLLAVFRKTLN